jgi:hypothetical protein
MYRCNIDRRDERSVFSQRRVKKDCVYLLGGYEFCMCKRVTMSILVLPTIAVSLDRCVTIDTLHNSCPFT